VRSIAVTTPALGEWGGLKPTHNPAGPLFAEIADFH
jgi:hypothetical protein